MGRHLFLLVSVIVAQIPVLPILGVLALVGDAGSVGSRGIGPSNVISGEQVEKDMRTK